MCKVLRLVLNGIKVMEHIIQVSAFISENRTFVFFFLLNDQHEGLR